MMSKDILVVVALIIATILLVSIIRKGFNLNLFKMPENGLGLGKNKVQCLVLFVMWLLFTATVYIFHQRWWWVWHGTENWWGSPTFLLTQVIVIFAIIALPKSGFWRGVANTSLGLGILLSIGFGFMYEAKEKGLIPGQISEEAQMAQKWIFYSPDEPELRFPAQVVLKPNGKFELIQHSHIHGNKGVAKFTGECEYGRCQGKFTTNDDPRMRGGWWKLELVTDGFYGGFMKGERMPGKREPYEVPIYVKLMDT